jgi:hypothetical protein
MYNSSVQVYNQLMLTVVCLLLLCLVLTCDIFFDSLWIRCRYRFAPYLNTQKISVYFCVVMFKRRLVCVTGNEAMFYRYNKGTFEDVKFIVMSSEPAAETGTCRTSIFILCLNFLLC